MNHPSHIFRQGTRIALVLAIVLGVLLPRAGAVLAEVIPGIQRITICTGTEIVTLTIGADGQPIKETQTATPHCVMADGVSEIIMPLPYWQTLALSDPQRPAILDDPLADLTTLSTLRPVRAPPFS
ncbi:MAG: cell wall metabolism sensor histidine kinase WalK [Pelagimonas sp.]|jgi:hypothetical protein|nr:cell wall metabolism sensor histidine kinase WalK [Pelagimonas sp.]